MNSRLLAIGIPATPLCSPSPSRCGNSAPMRQLPPTRDWTQLRKLRRGSRPEPRSGCPIMLHRALARASAGDAADPRNMDVPFRFAFRNLPGASHLGVIVLNCPWMILGRAGDAVSAKTQLRSVVDVVFMGTNAKNLTNSGLEAETAISEVQSPPIAISACARRNERGNAMNSSSELRTRTAHPSGFKSLFKEALACQRPANDRG